LEIRDEVGFFQEIRAVLAMGISEGERFDAVSVQNWRKKILVMKTS
jgi:hypothetical protein